MDFDSNGKSWSASLANMDSDGDGRTNGQELQDPTGSWTQGAPNPGDPSQVTNPGSFDNFPDSTATHTPLPEPTNTPTKTSTTVSPTPTPTHTVQPTATDEPTIGPSNTPTNTPESPIATETATNTTEATETPEPTETVEPTETSEPTETPEPTETAEATPTRTPDGGGGEIEFEGSVSGLNLGEGNFLVGGILVRTDENTQILNDDQEPIGLDALNDGDNVEVEGTELEDGSVLATKIKVENEDGDDDDDDNDDGDDDDDDEEDCEQEFKGFISEINPASMTLVVGNVLLRATTATEILDDDENAISLEALSIGDFVEVEYCPDAGVPPLADRIKLEDDEESEEREFEVEGPIEALDLDMTSLVVNGSLIFATGASIREEEGPELGFSDLMVGDFVKVKGRVQPDSTIQATRIIRKDEDHDDCESKVRGTITMVDLDASSISVGVTQIQVDDQTRIKDDRTDQTLTLADLMVGDSVKVEFCARMGIPVALEIEVKEEDDYDLDDDGEAGEHEILEIIHEISRRGVSLDLNGDNRTNSDDLVTFSRRWKNRRN